MNTASNLSNNFMLLSQNASDNGWMKVCAEYIERYKVVLLLTRTGSFTDLSPIIKKKTFNRKQLESLVIVESDNVDGLVDKLLELQTWSWLPELIIIDLRSIIDNSPVLPLQNDETLSDKGSPNIRTFFKSLAFLIVTLMKYVESVAERLTQSSDSNKNCFSVLVLKKHADHLSSNEFELLVDLYYYADNAFPEDEVMEIVAMIKLEPE